MSYTSNKGGPNGSQEPSAFVWRGVQALRPVHDLNERCLELLTQLARSEGQHLTPPIVSQYQTLWRSLNGSARERAAHMPFLLMDVHFQDVDWWRAAQRSRPHPRRKSPQDVAFTKKVAAELMRESVMLAWNTVSLDRGAASILLGMTPAVSDIIAEFGPQDVERVATRYSQYLRPRWQDFPAFWVKLLTAARDADEDALHESRLHGVQLIGGELLPRLDEKFV